MRIMLHGHGEPLVNKQFIQIVQKACTMYKEVKLYSNGIALTEEMSDNLLETGISTIMFSVTGFDYKTYNKFQGYGSNDDGLRNKVYSNIEYLIKKRNENMHKTFIWIQYILTEETKEDFRDYINHWDGLADAVSISSLTFSNREIEGFTDKNKSLQGMSRPCISFGSTLLLHADGSVSACCGDYNRTLIVGNYKTQTAEEIRSSPKYTKLADALTKTLDYDSLPQICKDCEAIRVKEDRGSVFCWLFKPFKMDKISALKNTPLVLYGASDILMAFILKIKLYSDIKQYDFLIVDSYKNGYFSVPLCSDNEEFEKYKLLKPAPEILSNRRIIVFAESKFEEVRLSIEAMGFSCESFLSFI